MVTLQIDVPETVARMIEKKVRERRCSQAGDDIQELVQADHAVAPQRRINDASLEALQSDPTNDIELTPDWWDAKRTRLVRQMSDGVLL